MSHVPRNIPSSSWPAVADSLKKLPRNGLLQLLKDLYHTHPQAQQFLEARLEVGPLGAGLEAAFRSAKAQLIILLRNAETSGLAPFSDARKLNTAYRKAALDETGYIRLEILLAKWSLHKLRHGAGPEIATPLRPVLKRIDKVLRTPDGRVIAAQVAPKLRELADLSASCGYGLGDELPGWVNELLEGIPETPSPKPTPRRYDGDPDFDAA